MNNGKVLAGIDAGHVSTKAVLMKGQEVLGYGISATGFDVVGAALTALGNVLEQAGISALDVAGIVTTGIYRDAVKDPSIEVVVTVPEYAADARGALFLNRNSRTVIDIGGNVHKAVHYDEHGDLLDVIQNDKCADGLGLFYTSMAKALVLTEQELSELALKSTRDVSVAIQCALSAESEAIDLLCQGIDITDVANAVSRFLSERVAAMCTYLPLTGEIVVVGGLAKATAVVKHLSALLEKELSVADHPEYVGAIGAVTSYGGAR
ncbi:MAG TPA: hypothetical protein DCR97_14900 [Deltaproteobacteria bacterium]|nr:hypothetical protein [Deltaproteobacteria bacterium]